MYVWLLVCDVIVRTCSAPFLLSYPTTDTYAQHGQDLLRRLTMENSLSHFSGITWSRDIYRRPTQAELRRGHVRQVDVLDPLQTGFFNINLVNLTSMTLGSFQPRQGKITMKIFIYKAVCESVSMSPYIQDVCPQLGRVGHDDCHGRHGGDDGHGEQ